MTEIKCYCGHTDYCDCGPLLDLTATQWLFDKLWDTPKDKFEWYAILKEAEEMEKNGKIHADNGKIHTDNRNKTDLV
jgi:hypothetical protein